VIAARSRQEARLGEGRANADMTPAETRHLTKLTPDAKLVLIRSAAKHRLTGRGRDRVLRVAQTVADLDGVDAIDFRQISEALSLRSRTKGD
jgi:magnesium chelatase family protein